MTGCRWVASDQPRMLRNRHGDECPMREWHPPLTWDCAGCQPCGQLHCVVCGREHVDQLTCPECVGDVRDDLADIVRLSGRPLIATALTRQQTSEAAHLLGPTSDPFQRRQRMRHGMIPDVHDVVDEAHPLWVLGTWDLLVSEHYDHDARTERVTIPDAAGYLARNLTSLAQDGDFPFPELAKELRTCRGHLEDVTAEGERVDKGAPCLTCGRLLERQINETTGRAWYRCARCNDDLTDSEYLMAQKDERLWTAHLLTADDMATRTDVPASTIRRWANVRRINGEDHPPLFRSVGRNGQGRKVYRVVDVEAVRDTGGDVRGRAAHIEAMAGIVSNEGAV